ncbi:MAG: DUF1826 domain-containing protein, partial [Pseudomonadota bacterium]|nr:DUF1826 domain-containing protein [Pseudomonadota bacterium]
MNHQALANNEPTAEVDFRQSIAGTEPLVLADIYESNCNLAVWRRELSEEVESTVKTVLENSRRLQSSMVVSPDSVHKSIQQALRNDASAALCEDITQLVDMFCCLFD